MKLNFALLPALVCCIVAPARADLVISEIDLLGDKVELVNLGDTTVDISSYWWCNRVNGSPFYSTIASASTIDTSLSTATSFGIGTGEILVLDLTSSFLPDLNGELGLYNRNSFSSSAAIVNYILWGGNGIRDSVAAAAGLWIDNDSIDVSGLSVGDSVQLSPNAAGNQAGDYFVGTASLGVAQSIVEPCDFNFDGVCNVPDIDRILGALGTNDPQLDLDGSGTVDDGDITGWLADAATENGFAEPLLRGDTDLNGRTDAADLNNLAVNWQITNATSWMQGDFNGDHIVDAIDLNQIGLSWQTEIALAALATAPVPEPQALQLFVLGGICLTFFRNRFSPAIAGLLISNSYRFGKNQVN